MSRTPDPAGSLRAGWATGGIRLVFVVLTGALVVWIWSYWSTEKRIREDEMLHLHDIWEVAQGAVPYRDFFEHHAPWYHFLMAPVCRLFEPETSGEAAVAFVRFAKNVSLAMVFCGLVLLVCVCRIWRNIWLGCLTVLLLSGTPFFLETAIETRPDTFAFTLWMLALCLFHRGLNHESKHWYLCPFLWAGLLLGCSVMFTQKMLFALPGSGLVLCAWALAGNIRSRLIGLVLFGCGLLLPMLLTWLHFRMQGAGTAFIDGVFLINARWNPDPEKNAWIFELFLKDSRNLLVLGYAGALIGIVGMIATRKPDWFLILIIATVAGWFVGLFRIIPVLDRQFYMISLPLISLLGAHAVMEIPRACVRLLQAQFRKLLVPRSTPPEEGNGEVDAPHKKEAPDPCRHPVVMVVLQTVSILCVLWLIRDPLENSHRQEIGRYKRFDKLPAAAWVVDNTDPRDTFLEAFSGAGTFRPQAWRYGFVHSEIPDMLEWEVIEDLMESLRSGSIRPEIIPEDFRQRNLHPDMDRWIRQHYHLVMAPSRVLLWRRKPDSPRGLPQGVEGA